MRPVEKKGNIEPVGSQRDPDELRIDMHIHSEHSSDSATPVQSIVRS